MKILAIGDLIWDVYPDNSYIGGATFNFSAHAARRGAEVWLMSAVGNDEFGHRGIAAAEKFGIKTGLMQVNEHMTGKTLVTLDSLGHPSFEVLKNVAFDNIKINADICTRISEIDFDVLYFGTLVQRLRSADALRLVLERCSFREIFCDINLRDGSYCRESVETCFSHATVLKLSAEEEPLLREMGFYGTPIYSNELKYNEAVAKTLCRKYPGIKVVIVTMGNRGSFVYEKKTGLTYYLPVVPCPVVSTVGAGDSYCAAWLTSWYGGNGISRAMNDAAELSNFVVSHMDAVP